MESAEDAVISSKPKSVAELKTNPEPAPSLISASCLPRWQRLSRWFSWKPLPGSWKTRGQELRVARSCASPSHLRGCCRARGELQAQALMSRRNSRHSLPTYLGPKQEPRRAGEFILLAFSSAEVIGSDQWGKQKRLSSFPTPREGYSLSVIWLQLPGWCIYFTAVALSAQSSVRQQKKFAKTGTYLGDQELK